MFSRGNFRHLWDQWLPKSGATVIIIKTRWLQHSLDRSIKILNNTKNGAFTQMMHLYNSIYIYIFIYLWIKKYNRAIATEMINLVSRVGICRKVRTAYLSYNIMCGSFSFAELILNVNLAVEVMGAFCKTQYDTRYDRYIETQNVDCTCEIFCLSYSSQIEVWEDYMVYANPSSHEI